LQRFWELEGFFWVGRTKYDVVFLDDEEGARLTIADAGGSNLLMVEEDCRGVGVGMATGGATYVGGKEEGRAEEDGEGLEDDAD
jgi:hypothetical protein